MGKEYIVTDPSGKEFVVTAPDGATQEQALEFAKSQFGQTPGGAAIGNPSIAAQGASSSRPRIGLGESVGAIGGAGAIGSVLGAASPEILTGLGAAASAHPATAPLGNALLYSGRAVRGARGLAAVAGGVSGLSGETAGQVAEHMGANRPTAEGARIAGGMITPEFVGLAKWGLEKFIQTPALSFWRKMTKESVREVAAKMGLKEEDLSDQQRKFLEAEIEKLRGGVHTDDPARAVYSALESEAGRVRSVASDQARKLLADAERRVARGNLGRQRLDEIGSDALSTAQAQRINIGDDVEMSDIGGRLRQLIVSRNQAALDARRAQYSADEKVRDALVAQKENAGSFINKTPEYDQIIAELKSSLESGKRSPDVQGNIKYILGQITNHKKDVFRQDMPISFQAIDDVRRALGEAFRGKPPEGYGAIGTLESQRLYQRLSDLQKKYVGHDVQSRLLDNYADSTEGLSVFSSKYGKRATALDKYDASKFQTDQSNLPRQFFSSKQSVKDLIELSGDRDVAVKSAMDYATNQLRDSNSKEVRAWLTKNRDWLTEMPEVRTKVSGYADVLEQGERVWNRTRLGAENSLSVEKRITGQASAGAERVVRDADALALKLVNGRSDVRTVRELIESGDMNLWRAVKPAIESSQSAKANLVSSVRQVIANRAETNHAAILQFWKENVRPGLEGTGLVPVSELDDITAQITRIAKLQMPEREKLGLARRMMWQAVGGYASTLGSRAAIDLFVPQ